MSDLLSEILILFFEVLCSKIFYETFGKVRKKGWINIAQLILLESSVLLAVRALSGIFILKQIVVVSIYRFYLCFGMLKLAYANHLH